MDNRRTFLKTLATLTGTAAASEFAFAQEPSSRSAGPAKSATLRKSTLISMWA
jgi:hypothetical protein